MSYFDNIPPHKTAVFRFEDVPYSMGRKYIKAYYHRLTDFIPCHTHDFYEINIVCDGIGLHQLEKKEILTRRGDVFVIPPHTAHGYSCKQSLTVYHILLSNSFTDRFSPLLKEMKGYNLIFNVEPKLRGHIDKPYYLRAEDVPYERLEHYTELTEGLTLTAANGNEAAVTAHILSLIALLSEAMYAKKPLDTDEIPDAHILSVLEGMEYIEKHYAEKIDFKRLAMKSAFSYSTYLKYFKSLSGTTPVRYQNKCKINSAANMLISTGDSILSVALSCGFYDSSHFIREFIRERHISPTDYRKSQR